ncbi:thioredoxin-dependent thiol peroxidase [Candidatus Peregrinibacteria bacterium]|jgi:thioredoxin-dependent peroxiredoxin|nr:thioredoxin-dependent thiol peroxidase [Candidatus Peregrinibacteria bacterium]
MAEAGKEAPDFTLQDQDWETHSISDFRGQKVLLYFYPRDNTPGCTVQACNFRDNLDKLKKRGVHVVGVSGDSVESHKKFVAKHNLNFPLLADTEKDVAQMYKVWVEKNMYGRKHMGIQRDSFLINENGVVMKHYKKVKPNEHIEEVLRDAGVRKR